MTKQSKKITMSKRRRKDKTKGLVPETSKRKNNQKQKQYSKKEFKIKHNHNIYTIFIKSY